MIYAELRSVRQLCTLALLTSPALGQTIYDGARHDVPWRGPAPIAATELKAGRITDGDPLQDAVVLSGTDLVLLHGPGENDAQLHFASGVAAFELWRDGINPSSVMASNATGLEVYAWSASLQAMESLGHASTDIRTHNASSLSIIENGGSLRLAGVSADGSTVFCGSLVGNTFSADHSFSVAGQVKAWCYLQWDGSGPLELLVHDANGLNLFDEAGNALWAAPYASTAANPHLTRFRDPNLGADRAVWSTTDTAGAGLLFVLDQRLPAFEPPLAFGPLQVGALDMFDWNGDGLSDLFLSSSSIREARVLTRQGEAIFPTQNTFTLTESEVFNLHHHTTPVQTGASLGVGADFDLDGDVDLLLVSNDDAHIELLRNKDLNDLLYKPVPLSTQYNVYGPLGGPFNYGVTCSYLIPWGAYPPLPGTLNSPISTLEVEILLQTSYGAEIDGVRLDHAFVELDESSFSAPEVTLDFPVADVPPGAVFQFRARVHVEQAGTNEKMAGPAWITLESLDPTTADLIAAETDPWTEASISLLPPIGGSSTPGLAPKPNLGPYCTTCAPPPSSTPP